MTTKNIDTDVLLGIYKPNNAATGFDTVLETKDLITPVLAYSASYGNIANIFKASVDPLTTINSNNCHDVTVIAPNVSSLVAVQGSSILIVGGSMPATNYATWAVVLENNGSITLDNTSYANVITSEDTSVADTSFINAAANTALTATAADHVSVFGSDSTTISRVTYGGVVASSNTTVTNASTADHIMVAGSDQAVISGSRFVGVENTGVCSITSSTYSNVLGSSNITITSDPTTESHVFALSSSNVTVTSGLYSGTNAVKTGSLISTTNVLAVASETVNVTTTNHAIVSASNNATVSGGSYQMISAASSITSTNNSQAVLLGSAADQYVDNTGILAIINNAATVNTSSKVSLINNQAPTINNGHRLHATNTIYTNVSKAYNASLDANTSTYLRDARGVTINGTSSVYAAAVANASIYNSTESGIVRGYQSVVSNSNWGAVAPSVFTRIVQVDIEDFTSTTYDFDTAFSATSNVIIGSIVDNSSYSTNAASFSAIKNAYGWLNKTIGSNVKQTAALPALPPNQTTTASSDQFLYCTSGDAEIVMTAFTDNTFDAAIFSPIRQPLNDAQQINGVWGPAAPSTLPADPTYTVTVRMSVADNDTEAPYQDKTVKVAGYSALFIPDNSTSMIEYTLIGNIGAESQNTTDAGELENVYVRTGKLVVAYGNVISGAAPWSRHLMKIVKVSDSVASRFSFMYDTAGAVINDDAFIAFTPYQATPNSTSDFTDQGLRFKVQLLSDNPASIGVKHIFWSLHLKLSTNVFSYSAFYGTTDENVFTQQN